MKDTDTVRDTSAYEGKRCHICIGCGRCNWQQNQKMQVLTKSTDFQGGFKAAKSSLENPDGIRLVTADIGTTTIAVLLYNAEGIVQREFVCVNPQVKYGADVLSRIQAAESPEVREELRRMVTEKLEEAISDFRQELGEGERLQMVLAGNTTMIYLLCGFDPAELGRAPFTASHLSMLQVQMGEVPCIVFPGVSAFVGGDITAGMLACGMDESEEITLLIDLGTNGEMVLGNSKERVACATAAGPAFEGGVNRGVWGADMVAILAELRRRQIVDETGLLAEPYFEQGIRIGDVRVTQPSIRAIQLAKAAIGAGIRILLQEYGGTGMEIGRIDKVVLAGGFGYYLKPQAAAAIRLLPEELVPCTVAGGNTALSGALKLGRQWLTESGTAQKDKSFAQNVKELCNTKVLNLAQHKDFETYYLEQIGF